MNSALLPSSRCIPVFYAIVTAIVTPSMVRAFFAGRPDALLPSIREKEDNQLQTAATDAPDVMKNRSDQVDWPRWRHLDRLNLHCTGKNGAVHREQVLASSPTWSLPDWLPDGPSRLLLKMVC